MIKRELYKYGDIYENKSLLKTMSKKASISYTKHFKIVDTPKVKNLLKLK